MPWLIFWENADGSDYMDKHCVLLNHNIGDYLYFPPGFVGVVHIHAELRAARTCLRVHVLEPIWVCFETHVETHFVGLGSTTFEFNFQT